ncbi:MAG TPA: FeoA family protein [Flavobacteriaceae bacterium]|jgi:ferrous iron transport protein A|nr:FeoA family protein [Flavobacteriaceae bacterium]|tara:strand:- start:382 stop:624 length:243 start_codon:yes stop_codon:yes gene_type:complete
MPMQTAADLKKGEKAIIKDVSSNNIPIKLLEMGCLPGNEIEIIQLAPLLGPIYININGSRLAIRKGTARLIIIDKPIKNE